MADTVTLYTEPEQGGDAENVNITAACLSPTTIMNALSSVNNSTTLRATLFADRQEVGCVAPVTVLEPGEKRDLHLPVNAVRRAPA